MEETSEDMITVTTHEIEGVELSDGGVFVCIAENEEGDTERSTTLTVGGKSDYSSNL